MTTLAPTRLTPSELKYRLDGSQAPIVIDVRLREDFDVEHIPGAVSNCVFEVAFEDRLQNQAPLKHQPVCVYGSGDASYEAPMAADKLLRAGYDQVQILDGGVAGWEEAGLGLKRGGSRPKPPVIRDGRYVVDCQESRLEWTGKNLLNKHWGTIGLKSGTLEVNEGIVSGGEFVIDMRSIRSLDLAGDPLHDVLVRHLESDDFFDVERYPEARFEIQTSEQINGGMPGSANLRIQGVLHLKDKAEPVQFDVTAGVAEGAKLAAQTSFSIDRTRWNVLYGSGRFFSRLAGHLVNDTVDLQLRVLAH